MSQKPEPSGVPALEPQGLPLAFRGVPDYLREAEALGDRIQNVEELVSQFGALQPFAQLFRMPFVQWIVGASLNADRDLAHRPPPRPDDARVVEVPFLDGFGELEVAHDIALVSAAQDLRQPIRGQTVAGVAGDRRAHPADCSGRHLPFEFRPPHGASQVV